MDGTLLNKKYNIVERIAALEESGSYELPIASASTLGGVKIGDNLEIDESGVLSASYDLPIASASTLGGVKIGDNLEIDESGVLSASAGGNEWSTDEHEVGTWLDGTPVYERTISVTLGGSSDTDRLLVSGLAPTRAWIVDSDFVNNTGSEKLHFYLGARVNGVWTTGFLINKSDGLYVRLNNNYAGVEGLSGYVTIRYVKPAAVNAKKRVSKKTEQ